MSDDEQTQLEAHAPVEGGAQLSHGPGTAAETGPAALAGAAEAVTDPPATLHAHMIADLANFVPAGTNVEAAGIAHVANVVYRRLKDALVGLGG